ncbi:sensor domain-containing diguanylate cyclase [Sediminispirochaeta bajacaliforniensis]|uniref:sensor domain-containing diguanylate cyclase n=1 Tax=Sediminispirochaeta bajacaliforniensis TaxID=148 RepID=UPI0003779475|nr:sensor domain-containing diguanylate cyclase [Sediminispirochaeta bajacaliforniensis]
MMLSRLTAECRILLSPYSQHRRDFVAYNRETNAHSLFHFSILLHLSVLIWIIFCLFDGSTVIFYLPVLFLSIMMALGSGFIIFHSPCHAAKWGHTLLHVSILLLFTWVILFCHYSGLSLFSSVLFMSCYLLVSSIFLLHPFFIIPVYLAGALIFYASDQFADLNRALWVALGLMGLMASAMRWILSFHRFRDVLDIKKKREKINLAMEGAGLGFWSWDIGTDCLEADDRWFSMLNRKPVSALRFEELLAMMHRADRHIAAQKIKEALQPGKESYEQIFRLETDDGSYRWISSKGMVTRRGCDGSPLEMHGIHQDVHARMLQQQKLIQSESRFRAYAEHSPVAVFVFYGRAISYANPQASSLTGYSLEELLSFPDFFVLVAGSERVRLKARLALFRTFNVDDPRIVFQLLTRTGKRLWVEGYASMVEESGEVLFSLVDVTLRHQAQMRLSEYATYDELTGVYNRRVGLAMLEKELHRSKRERLPLTVGFADIDRLKLVNDTLGHEAGDRLITRITAVMKRILRSGDVICRLGGDEFLLIHPNCTTDAAKQLRIRIDEELAREAVISEGIPLSVSIGYSSFEPASTQYELEIEVLVDQLVNCADQRMYRHKRDKKS